MATKQEEQAEQAFFAGKIKEQQEESKMATHTKDSEHKAGGEVFKDSLGQENPAHDLEKKNLEEAAKRHEEQEAQAKKAEKAG
jgi:hypothetical protein